MRFGTYLRALRRQRGRSLTDLARQVGVSIAYLSDIEKRPQKRPPTPERVDGIAAALDLDPDEARRLHRLALEGRLPREFHDKVTVKVEARSPTPPMAEVVAQDEAEGWPARAGFLPLLAEVPAGNPRDVNDEVIDERPVPRSVARPGRYLLRVDGTSMRPMLEPGDLVLVDSTVHPSDRQIVAARIAQDDEDQSTIKQLFVRPNGVLLHPLNPEFQDMILLRTGELDESGAELFEYEGRRVRLFLKGVILAIVWREVGKG